MKEYKHMVADQAAAAFYGQDMTAFTKEIGELTAHDPRLAAVFQRTRADYQKKRAQKETKTP